ncbi:MAG: 16S rRNA (cytidine(1402)-2'-O)-methyltransferase [Bacilli bacterium]|nr:16S rRNA (cytidine(1402)-2'-O)-methyltransferase [Bacilli bacterium]
MVQKSYDGKATLYLIPTPIGNLEDITMRSLKILNDVDFLLCEDTRVTSILLNKYKIKKSLVRCDEYSQKKVKDKVLKALSEGKNVGLVSDAGSPVISDPGFIISKYVIDASFNVVALPGATAFVPALSVSGIFPSPFIFYGFLDNKITKKRKELDAIKMKTETLIFYESPHHLISTLEVMLDILGDRSMAICREISKIHEEVIRGKISECIDHLDNIKGEFVLIVEGATLDNDFHGIDIISHVNLYIEDGFKKMDAIKMVAKERGIAKSIVYKEYNKDDK